jgi:hypothetical protein
VPKDLAKSKTKEAIKGVFAGRTSGIESVLNDDTKLMTVPLAHSRCDFVHQNRLSAAWLAGHSEEPRTAFDPRKQLTIGIPQPAQSFPVSFLWSGERCRRGELSQAKNARY